MRVTRTQMRSIRRNDVEYTRKTFPLALAYVMTAHRAQGATLAGRVILSVRKAFAPAITYVMLSRATHRDSVFILGSLTPQDFTPVNAAAFLPGSNERSDSDDSDGDDSDSDD